MIESQFEELQAVVERAKREVTEILEGESKQAIKQAEGIRVHLEQRCTELKKTQTQVEKLSKNKNDVDFLQVTGSSNHAFPYALSGFIMMEDESQNIITALWWPAAVWSINSPPPC